MPGKPSLDSAYVLVRDAGKYINKLKSLHNEIVAAQAEATIIKSGPDQRIEPGEIGVIAEGEVLRHVPIPDDFRVALGHAANDLRTALNYLVMRLAMLDTGTRSEIAQFPIFDAASKFWGKNGKRRSHYLDGVSDAHAAAIERLQPYKGCDWTAKLQTLSNFHKHDDLIVVRHVYNVGFWPAPGSEDTKFGVTMGPEVGHGASEVYAGVQA